VRKQHFEEKHEKIKAQFTELADVGTATPAQAIGTNWFVGTPSATARVAHASEAGKRSFRVAPSNLPMNDLRETPSSNGRFNFVNRRRFASNCKLCSSVLPKPMPTSSTTCAGTMPPSFSNAASCPEKNPPTSRTTLP